MVDLGRLEHPLLDQMAAYRELQQELESKYFGRWVVIDDGKLVGNYATFDEAEAAAKEQGLNPSAYLVRQVGTEPPLLLSYGR